MGGQNASVLKNFFIEDVAFSLAAAFPLCMPPPSVCGKEVLYVTPRG
jgi:hypothetical protein